MTSPQELHISFRHLGADYNINLVKGGHAVHLVQINGMSYAVLGDEEKLKAACKILGSVSLESISNSEDLLGRLSLIENISFPPTQKTDDIGVKNLSTKQEFRAWKKDEEENLHKTKKFVAQIFWGKRENTKSLAGIRKFLGEEKFDNAIKSNDFEKFLSLFDDLSADELWDVRNNENCQPLGYVKTEPYEITEEDRINLKHYLDDIGFSGVVSLSDAKGTYTITPTKKEFLENTSFSMNSISKVFTGTLALMTMSPEELKDKIQLSPMILSFLEQEKKEVYYHLKKPSLLQTMNHDGGFGDYLRDYEKAVVDALENRESQPLIRRPEDFLKYAETTTYPLDSGIYSNLGILLVGLAIQHKCKDKPYDQLLKELILAPADINVSKSKPEGGRFSESDPCKGMTTGSPSGGYWTTTKELIKLGTWLQGKCSPPKKGEKSEFLTKLELYGKEFYVPEDEEIHHNGCSSAGSSFLSSFLQSGVTIAILSDQGNFMANRIHYTIRQKLIEKSD
jgi:hypothetical protein